MPKLNGTSSVCTNLALHRSAVLAVCPGRSTDKALCFAYHSRYKSLFATQKKTTFRKSKTALQVHAEGEAEHAAIGHSAVAGFVPASHMHIVRQAMKDHDRDFSAFYTALAKMLEN